MHDVAFDRQIAVLARRQHGVFHTGQARVLGGTSAMLRRRLVNGTLLQMAANVWALPGNPLTWQRQYKAAELSVRGAAICDRAAALVHRCDGSRVVRPVIAVGYAANARQSIADVRRVRDVPTTVVDGIRVVTLAQTLFDLLACVPLADVERAVDGALLARGVAIHDLMERADAMSRARRPNVKLWRELVEERRDDGWAPPESELERALDLVVRRLPPGVEVLRQATPVWWEPASHRVDVYIPGWALVVEADGRRWHARAADFDRDRWRDNRAVANGHRVLRFTHTHLSRRGEEVLELLLAAGRHRLGRAV
jgi:very-short-patch-repair endonuclease